MSVTGTTTLVLAHPPPRFEDNTYTGRWARAFRDVGVSVQGLTIAALVRNRDAIVHVHWPEHLLSGDSLAKRVAKTANTLVMLTILTVLPRRVFLTAHNAKPHEIPLKGFQKLVLRWLHHLGTGMIMTAPGHAELLTAMYPALEGMSFHVIPLGTLVLEQPRTQELADEWPLDSSEQSRPARFVQFGSLSPYKQQDKTLDQLEPLISRGEATLVIVGRVLDPDFAARLKSRVDELAGAIVIDHYVSDVELSSLIANADASLALQRGALNSGVMSASIPLGTPVVSADTLQAQACQSALGQSWVRCVEESVTEQDWEAIALWAQQDRDGGRPEYFDWSSNIELHLRAYDSAS